MQCYTWRRARLAITYSERYMVLSKWDEMTSKPPRRNLDWGLWFQWVLATTMGLSISMLLQPVFGRITAFNSAHIASEIYEDLILGISVGVSLGLSQGLVLRRNRYSMYYWILACVVGCVSGVEISHLAIAALEVVLLYLQVSLSGYAFIGVLALALAGGITGIALGSVQRRIMRRKMPLINHWKSVNAVSWMLGCTLGASLGIILNQNPIWLYVRFAKSELAVNVLCAISTGLVVGVITGYPLMCALRQSPVQNPESEI